MASWSPDDVRKQAPNWSLEGDGKLLEYMESISKTLDQKCNATLTNINKMLLSIDETNVSLGNTTNKLLALQHAQFVENRVYDDDETTIGSVANSSSRDLNSNFVKKSNGEVLSPMGAIQLAIDNGINMLGECYEKVSLDLDDDESDDDDVGVTNIVFQPKDPYIDKPLPFIIGSKEWKEKWHVGLLESDLESDNENEVEEFSDTSSSNPSLSASIPSNAPTISESEGSVWGLNTTAGTPSNSKPQKDLFNNSSSSDEDDRGVSRNVNLFDPNDVISKHNQMKKEQTTTEPENKPSTQPVVQQTPQTIFREQQPARKIVNLFDDEPPELDALSSSSSGSKHVAAQPNRQKPLNLFDESDNENDDDIFLTKKSNHVPSKPSVHLFNDTPPPADEPKEIAKTKPAKIVTNLFDDDNDNDDIGIVTVVKAPMPTVRSKITNLFDDDVPDDDLDLFIESKKTKSKMTASSSSSSVSETRPIPASSKITKLFDDDEDDYKEFGKILTKQTNITTSVTPKEIAKPVLNLFADEEEKVAEKEEIKAVPIPAARTVKPEVVKPKPTNLFEDDDDDNFSASLSKTKESPLKSEIVKPNIPANIFANDDDDEIVSSAKLENFEEAAPQIVESNKVKVASVKKLSPPKLFDDFGDDEDDFYSTLTTKKSEPSKLPEERVPIVEDIKEEVNPGTEVKTDVAPSKSINLFSDEAEVKTEIAPSKSINLFSDEPPDDDFDELFKGNAKKPSIKAPPEVPPLDNNDDEDWLVSSSKSSSIFDKFNDEPPTVTPPQSERKTSITTSALQFSSVRLFDDMPPSDDDIDGIPDPPPILSSSSSSKSHIYYDDTDTFNSVDTTKSIPVTTGYVINDEPPVDDYQDSSNKDEPDRTAPTNTNFKDKLNAFKNTNTSSNSSSSDSDKKIKTQPKKLNTNKLSINVGALLPGAKRPTINEIIKKNSTTSSDENMSSAEEKIDTTPKYNEAIVKAAVIGDGDKNILQSLQKSRAKIQVKRRPSTRQARHEVYRKSVIDDDGKIEGEVAVIPTSKSEPISITQALLNLRNDDDKSEFVDPPKITEIPKLSTSNKISLFDDNEFEISKPLPPIPNNVKELPKKISVFDDDDLVEVPKKRVEVTKPAEQVLKPPTKIFPEQIIPSSREKPEQTKTISLFDDDEDDDLFSKKSVQPAQRKLSPPTVKPTPKSAIFDDEEDLFARPPPIHKVDVKPFAEQHKQPLFSSDEDNDLFGSLNVPSKKNDPSPPPPPLSTTTKKPPPTKSTTSNIKLFDSDDDNEDDLFGPPASSSSSSTTTTTTKTTTSGKKSISQGMLFAKSTANNKLFDDSDGDDGNDDDIFKSKFVSSNRTTVPASKSSTSLSKSDKKIIKSTEIIDNDPLADLLK